MSGVKRINAGRLVRIARTSVALAARLAAVAPAQAAGVDSVDVARVEQQLQEAQYARVGIEGRTHVLIKPIQIDQLEQQTALLEQQLRWAHYTRIGIDGHTFELINPHVGAEGLAYERIPGFPKQRPAVVAGADWDSVAMPSNPIPWSRIDRIETGYPAGTHGARNGALIGLVAGVVMGTVGLAKAQEATSEDYGPLVLISAVVWAPLLGAFVGSAFHTTRWEQVYPGSKSDQR